MSKRSGTAIWLLMAVLPLAGCDLFQPKPQNAAVTIVPALPAKAARLDAYADADGTISLQSRPGDCVTVACLQFTRGKWRPMAKVQVKTLPLLAVAPATGSAYDDTLWHRIGASGKAVLINRQAGAYNVTAGKFDGLRIGLQQGASTRYVVAYSLERGEILKAHNVCLEGEAPRSGQSTDCARKVGENLYIAMPDAEVFTTSEKAWLVHRRVDGTTNLIDLFAANNQPDPHLCAPGLLLDSAPAGDYRAALSPDMFVSRAINPGSGEGDRLSCFLSSPKP